ncbi:serine/threonine protein kinase [Telmatocola sphagniphila]|uniref:Serine/threonine protein kinase n=1 Tax=Telmatocola sphagniphila TaxID=1123043 RepID=A0A8E6B2N2_9BACT|nr:serine/threonine-protein kinase [Telmatocola sphagniphila]QVL30586.1 serine/threonine protein kinase [Telmatocola sphagniphila]
MSAPDKRHDETGDFTEGPSDAPNTPASNPFSNYDRTELSSPKFTPADSTDQPTELTKLHSSVSELDGTVLSRSDLLEKTQDSKDQSGTGNGDFSFDTANTIDSQHREMPVGNGTDGLPEIRGFDIQQEIGRGGMGVVFKGRQKDLNRLVAIKMLISEKFPSSEDLIRFRLEAEVAARIRHPNVVQVYDSGNYNRSPYLVLEWVDGGTLSDILRGGKKLSQETAARLIALLARAIHHAHCNGVVHRDLKPANVLLARTDNLSTKQSLKSVVNSNATTGNISAVMLPIDQEPQLVVPKVTDFGLAKLTVASTGLTETGRVMGTPEYMSPEQASGRTKDVGPEADMHALGVMLYQMLTGETPFHADTKIAVIKKVVDLEVKPTLLQKERVSWDLQTICLKCLMKKPQDRYETAAALAEDLEALIAGRPIKARPISRVERLWKLAKRNPAVSSLVSASVFLFLIGFAGVTWQWRRAEREKAHAIIAEGTAEQHAKTTDAVNDFIVFDMLSNASPEKTLGKDLRVIEVLDNAAQHVDGKFQEPRIDAGVRFALGRSYRTLGEPKKAVGFLKSSYETRLKELGAAAKETLMAEWEYALALDDDGKWKEAEKWFEDAEKNSTETFGATNDLTLSIRESYALSLLNNHDQSEKSRVIFQEILAALERQKGEKDPATLKVYNDLGYALYNQKNYDEALKMTQIAFERRKETLSSMHPDTLESENNLAAIYDAKDELEKAKDLLNELIPISRQVRGKDHIDTLSAINNLARIFYRQKDFKMALPLYEEAVEAAKNRVGADNPTTLKYRRNLAATYASMGRYNDADKIYSEVRGISEKTLPADHPERLQMLNDYGIVKCRTGKSKEGLADLREALEGRTKTLGLTNPDRLSTLYQISQAILQNNPTKEQVTDVENKLRETWDKLVAEKKTQGKLVADLANMLVNFELRVLLASELGPDQSVRRASGLAHAKAAYELQKPFQSVNPETWFKYCLSFSRQLTSFDNLNTKEELSDGKKLALLPAIEALEVARKLPDSEAKVAETELYLGQLYLKLNENESALPLLKDVYTYQLDKDLYDQGTSANNLGKCFKNLKRYKEAEEMLLKGHQAFEKALAISGDASLAKSKRTADEISRRKAVSKDDIVSLYQAMGLMDKAAEWKGK